jgi:hypothetical protein
VTAAPNSGVAREKIGSRIPRLTRGSPGRSGRCPIQLWPIRSPSKRVRRSIVILASV